MTETPLLDSTSSGSVPKRPTRVRRASCDGLLVLKARDEKAVVVVARRAGETRKDIFLKRIELE
jgi:hypothetical protein